MNKELTQEMFDSIDWQPLKDRISDMVGVPISLEVKLGMNRRGNKVIRLQSQDLAERAGVLSSTLGHLYVSDFSGYYMPEDDLYWLPVCFSYELKNGGTNSHDLLDTYYNFGTRTWEMKDRYTVKK